MKKHQDCTRDALDLPDLGEVNVTLPDWKTIELRYMEGNWAKYEF